MTHNALYMHYPKNLRSHTGSGRRNCTTGNREGLSSKATRHKEYVVSYPVPSPYALSSSSLDGWQKDEGADSQYNTSGGGVVYP